MCGCWERNLRKVGEKRKKVGEQPAPCGEPTSGQAGQVGQAGQSRQPCRLATLTHASFILKVGRVAERRLPDVIFSR